MEKNENSGRSFDERDIQYEWGMEKKKNYNWLIVAVVILVLLIGLIFSLCTDKPVPKLQSFAIQKGQSLISHVDYETAIQIAQDNSLPIWKVDWYGKPKAKISPEEALAAKEETDRIRIVVDVYPGDCFDPVDGKYILTHREQK